MAHTPGPWYVVDIDDWRIASETIRLANKTAWPMDESNVVLSGDECYVREDDLRLMAAAPDLLTLVEEIEWQPDRLRPGEWSCPWCHSFKQNGHLSYCPRQAALAKVRGEEAK